MINKICTKCKDEKLEKEFAIKHKERNKRSNICKECHKAYSAKHYQDNKSKCLEKHKLRKRALRQQVLDVYGNKCENCGCDEDTILELNHIYGGGNVERKQKGKYTELLYKEALEQDGKYNILCKVCNAQHYVETVLGIKGFTITFASMVK